jgi:hypothetical protein
MIRVRTYGPNSDVASADLNDIQDKALGIAQMNGVWIGGIGPPLRVNGSTQLYIPASPGLVLNDKVLPGRAAHSATLSAGGAANTWFYVYAWDNAGAIEYEVSTTVPVLSPGGFLFKTGQTKNYRYVGCFRSSTTVGQYVDCWTFNGTFHYDLGNQASFPFPLTAGTGTVRTVIALANYLPPHARQVRLRVRSAYSASAITTSVTLYNVAAGGYAILDVLLPNTGGTEVRYGNGVVTAFADSSRQVWYINSNASMSTDVICEGFTDSPLAGT